MSVVCAHGRRWNVVGHPVVHPPGGRVLRRPAYLVGRPPAGVPDKLSFKSFRCPCRALGLT